MRLNAALEGIDIVRRSASQAERDPELTGIEYDSRRVGAGSLFVAMRGEVTDGNRYISAALDNGASAILTDSPESFAAWSGRPDIAIAEVRHGRRAMALAAANLFGHPERQLAISGVTGTNGKTTTTFLLDGLLRSVHRKTVLAGTIEYHIADQVLPSPHTTPESRDLLALFRSGLVAGATEAVMEVSSHALAQGRVHGVPYDVAIFTNLTRDHLDFHGTMAEYFTAKQMLFDSSLGQAPRVAVLNLEDQHGSELAAIARAHGSGIFSYGIEAGEFRAEDVRLSGAGMRFTLHSPFGAAPIETRLIGRVNVYNLLAAAAAALARGLTLAQVVEAIATLPSVPGRFQTVDQGQPFTVVVDYAHTDDALRNLIALARELVRDHGGRVITLFGCGGDRDRSKRPLMGRAAAEGSDLVVLTSDNPRSEDPEAILADVLPGLAASHIGYELEPDRAVGIRKALEAARPGDIVLIAGKGHEKTQTLRDGVVPFDDVAIAASLLRERQA
jgi:UDP-N-acetylmuramoyl-L-alanyl-D-glutamate--2,6-diaminopimelate ligase